MNPEKKDSHSAQAVGFVKNQSNALVNFVTSFIIEMKTAKTKLKDLSKSNYELALALYNDGNNWNALRRFKMANRLAPDRFPLSYYYMGRIEVEGYQTVSHTVKMLIKRIIYTDLDMTREPDLEQAREYLNKSLELNPDHEETIYFLQYINDPASIRSIPLSLLKEKFDIDIALYQEFLTNIQYIAYRMLIDIVDQSLEDQDKRLTIGDLGCGTGLCAQYVYKRLLPRSIDGIDFTPQMLAYCAERDVQGYPLYNNLYEDDIESYLSLCSDKYDLLLASSVFNHIGALDSIFKKSYKALKSKGLLAFNIEIHDEEDTDIIFVPEESLFLFSHNYILNLAKKHHFEVINSASVNMYGDVIGIQYILQKS